MTNNRGKQNAAHVLLEAGACHAAEPGGHITRPDIIIQRITYLSKTNDCLCSYLSWKLKIMPSISQRTLESDF